MNEIEENIYEEIIGNIREERAFRILSDKVDRYGVKKRNISTYSIASLSVKFATEFGLNKDLMEAIAYTRDIAYPPYGRIGQAFLEEKYKEFNQAECAVYILKAALSIYNIDIPKELEIGIYNSFNKGNLGYSKEGKLIRYD
jgi:hypothetical protein